MHSSTLLVVLSLAPFLEAAPADRRGHRQLNQEEQGVSHRTLNCGELTHCYFHNILTNEDKVLEDFSVFDVVGSNDHTIRCDTSGSISKVEFHYDNIVQTENTAPYFMGGDYDGWVKPVEYLNTCAAKSLTVVGSSGDVPCFEKEFHFYQLCDHLFWGLTDMPTESPVASKRSGGSGTVTKPPVNISTSKPSARPSQQPAGSPSSLPSHAPSKKPTAGPTVSPTKAPTNSPSSKPSSAPTSKPTRGPTPKPSGRPTVKPTDGPTRKPTAEPTKTPTSKPSAAPTKTPTVSPTSSPTATPTVSPTETPTASPTTAPSFHPTGTPTAAPTRAPSFHPTVSPTKAPSGQPTVEPTKRPTTSPTTSSPTTSTTVALTTSPTVSISSPTQSLPVPPLEGKKGTCFTLRAPGKNGSWEVNLPKVIELDPHWNYSWSHKRIPQHPDDIEFVPMFWGKWAIADGILNHIMPQIESGHAKRLLGFNEPDAIHQANMPVELAVDLWPHFNALHNKLSLISPSPAQPTGLWLRNFMDQVADADNIDQIGVHWYSGPNVANFKSRMVQLHEMYGGRPLMLTEFAVADWNAKTVGANRHSKAQVLAFMKQVIPWLEATEWIAGYAWFSFPESSPYGHCSALYDMDGQITSLGRYYASVRANNPTGDLSIV